MCLRSVCLAVSLLATQLDGVRGFSVAITGPNLRPRASWTRVEAGKLESLTVAPIKKAAGTIQLPGSKSLSNRALLLAALAEGETRVENLLDSDDINYMLKALKQLGVPITTSTDPATGAKAYTVTGNGGPFKAGQVWPPETLFLGNAGTAMRPLAAALCFGEGAFVLDGVERMRERPIADLVDGLRQLGCQVTCGANGCPPVRIQAAPFKGTRGGTAAISGQTSSQFISALLMAAPLAGGAVEVALTDELISAPYVALTSGLMAKFGVTVVNEGPHERFLVAGGQKYQSPGTVFVEGDASSASYFLAAGALTGGPVTVVGCGSESVQGDVAFARVLEQMGATVEWAPNSITVSRAMDGSQPLVGVDVDCGAIPDAAMTLAPVALFCEGPTTIRNVYSWRVKETERMVAIVTELGKLGVEVEESRDALVVHPPQARSQDGLPGVKAGVAIDTYDDHRMAMCFALVACAGVPVVINDPGCTSKTFPDFFEKLSSITEA